MEDTITKRLEKGAWNLGMRVVYILGKSCYVNRGEELLKWDFTLPFIISLLFPLIVYFPSGTTDADSRNKAFALFFAFIWIMGLLSAVNACLVGIYLDYLPVMSILLSEMLPICISAIAAKFVPFFLRTILVTLGVVYSLILAKRTFDGHVAQGRWLMVYQPIAFLYMTTGVLVLFNN